jgi:hypothetical protein
MLLKISWILQIDDEPECSDYVTLTALKEPLTGSISNHPMVETALKLCAQDLIPEMLDNQVMPAHRKAKKDMQ